MFLDLHTHSVASDDSRATVEQFVRWTGVLRKKGYQIDGFVLTEHRQFNHQIDYTKLGNENGLLILKGAELDAVKLMQSYEHFEAIQKSFTLKKVLEKDLLF